MYGGERFAIPRDPRVRLSDGPTIRFYGRFHFHGTCPFPSLPIFMLTGSGKIHTFFPLFNRKCFIGRLGKRPKHRQDLLGFPREARPDRWNTRTFDCPASPPGVYRVGTSDGSGVGGCLVRWGHGVPLTATTFPCCSLPHWRYTMAWYWHVIVRYRGRVVRVELRYGFYHNARVMFGKPLRLNGGHFPTSDDRRLAALCARKSKLDHSEFASIDPFPTYDHIMHARRRRRRRWARERVTRSLAKKLLNFLEVIRIYLVDSRSFAPTTKGKQCD